MSRRVNRVAPAAAPYQQADCAVAGSAVPQALAAVATATQEHPGCEARPGAAESAVGDGWELRRGDCLAGMAAMADDSVDVVITDPPYDENTHRNGRRGNKGIAWRRSGGRLGGDGAADERAYYNARALGFDALTSDRMQATASQFARVARRWSLVFCAIEMVGDSAVDGGHGWRAALERAGLEYVRTCVWHKLGATPQFTGDRPAQAVEAIIVAHRPGRKRWNGGGKHGYYAHPIVLDRGHGENRVHTTQKPLSLMRELVADFTEPGELVLDAYAGSATTLIAAVQGGRRAVGFELAGCAQCTAPAEWHCRWNDGQPQVAFLCDAHRAEVEGSREFRAVRDNYFSIACRRLRGEEAKPRPEQPGLFDAIGGTR